MVLFGLKNQTEPNYIGFGKYKPDWTEIWFKPNQFGSVKFGFLFCYKTRNLIR
jgi:hypothetical protein